MNTSEAAHAFENHPTIGPLLRQAREVIAAPIRLQHDLRAAMAEMNACYERQDVPAFRAATDRALKLLDHRLLVGQPGTAEARRLVEQMQEQLDRIA